jgi:DNA repair protein RadC
LAINKLVEEMEIKSGQAKVNEKAIKNWPEDERPREKLFKSGEHTLSKTELLAILLRSGVKGQSAIDLSRKILSRFKTFRDMSHTDLRDWEEFKGLGQAKIAQIKAAIEIGRRFLAENKESKGKINNSRDIADLFIGRMRDLKKEVFQVLLLNNRNNIIDTLEITEGTGSQAHPIIREIISKALQAFASGLVCVLMVYVPAIETQAAIVQKIKHSLSKLDYVERYFAKVKTYADKLEQSILAKAFRGELVPQLDK